MNPLLHSEIFILTLVTGVYLAALWLYRKTRLSLLHPLLVSIPVLALGIRFLGIPFATFETGSRIINFLLGPTVVALGYLLYEQREHLKANGISILTSVFVGSVIGIVSVVLIARWMGADRTLIASLEPKSVTTPIAMSIAQRSGGIPAIAAVVANGGKDGEVYNVGGHNERPNIFIVKTIINQLHDRLQDEGISEDLIKHVADRLGHDRRYGIDPTKIKNDLGWYPETPFEKGIVLTIDWYLAHPDWMAHVTSGDYQKYYEQMYKNK